MEKYVRYAREGSASLVSSFNRGTSGAWATLTKKINPQNCLM